MYHLPLTLETPAENLALDEALLDAAVEGELPGEVLRLWEPASFFVVLGRSSSLAEVRRENCAADGVEALRRPSGGATVVAGPGCLMYAVVLDAAREAACRNVDAAHRFVLGRIAAAIESVAPGVSVSGTSDLTLPGASPAAPRQKFSGNSLRLKRNHLLYHGTLLYDFPLAKLNHWLDRPARQPEYRDQRDHQSFVTNLDATREQLSEALINAWDATTPLTDWPRQRTTDLVAAGATFHPTGRFVAMHRQPLLDMLDRYAARHPGEQAVATRIRALVVEHADCFDRTCRPGHVTASAWVTTPQRDRVLLVHHRKLDRWLQPGGHADGQSDIPAAALREACEESGLPGLQIADLDGEMAPLDLDVHIIPARVNAAGELIEDAHEHHDVRFLITATGDLTPHVSDESHDVRWFTADELHAATDEDSVLRMWRKSRP